MRRWTNEEVAILADELKIGTTHEQIGNLLNRSKSSVMRKVQSLGWAKKGNSWAHLTDENLLELVRIYRTAEEFDTNPNIPSYKTIVRRLKVNTWNEVVHLAGLSPSKGTRYDYTKPTTFYILEFIDTDDIVFCKYGITQRSLQTRYKKRSLKVLAEETLPLQIALEKERKVSELVTAYHPKDRRFYSEGHGGYTECFIMCDDYQEQLVLPMDYTQPDHRLEEFGNYCGRDDFVKDDNETV